MQEENLMLNKINIQKWVIFKVVINKQNFANVKKRFYLKDKVKIIIITDITIDI